jgi:hypothetical protein
MTYGQLKLRVTQLFPGVSPEVIEGAIADRYAEILAELPWSRLSVETTLTTVIGQRLYPLPTNCRLLADDAFADAFGGLERFTYAQLNDIDPDRAATDTPRAWASRMDDNSTPPRMQVELYPAPDAVLAIPLNYTADAAPLTASNMTLQVWMQPAALIEGVIAKLLRYGKDYAGAQLAMVEAKNSLGLMRRTEAQGMAPAQIKLDSYFTSHRRSRWTR